MVILLAEDDIGVQYFVWKLLRSRGFIVINTADGETGLRHSRQHRTIDLLVTDVVMPGMDGLELYRRVAAEHPGIKVLLMSGAGPGTEDAESSGLPFLRKPFTPAALLTAVEAQLADRPPSARDDMIVNSRLSSSVLV